MTYREICLYLLVSGAVAACGEDTGDVALCLAGLEQEEFVLTNDARASAGVAPLQCDARIAEVARAHSQDMCERGYFSHTSLEGLSPFNRMQLAGIAFRIAGENIAAGNATAIATHNQWLNSSGHRRNILSSQYGRIGVGYAECDQGYRHYWTQVFAD